MYDLSAAKEEFNAPALAQKGEFSTT